METPFIIYIIYNCILYISYIIVTPLKATGKEEGLFVIKNTYPVRGFVLEGKLRFR